MVWVAAISVGSSPVFEVGLLFIKKFTSKKNNELLIEITSTPWTMNELQ